MSNVVALGNNALPGEPVVEVIESLESLLALAKEGAVRALAYAIVKTDDVRATGWDGDAGTSDALHAAVSMLALRYTQSRFADG